MIWLGWFKSHFWQTLLRPLLSSGPTAARGPLGTRGRKVHGHAWTDPGVQGDEGKHSSLLYASKVAEHPTFVEKKTSWTGQEGCKKNKPAYTSSKPEKSSLCRQKQRRHIQGRGCGQRCHRAGPGHQPAGRWHGGRAGSEGRGAHSKEHTEPALERPGVQQLRDDTGWQRWTRLKDNSKLKGKQAPLTPSKTCRVYQPLAFENKHGHLPKAGSQLLLPATTPSTPGRMLQEHSEGSTGARTPLPCLPHNREPLMVLQTLTPSRWGAQHTVTAMSRDPGEVAEKGSSAPQILFHPQQPHTRLGGAQRQPALSISLPSPVLYLLGG